MGESGRLLKFGGRNKVVESLYHNREGSRESDNQRPDITFNAHPQ